jgi:hypothetical protein
MRVRGLVLVAGAALCLAAAPGTSYGGVFLRGAAGWLEGKVYDTPARGTLFQGGLGGSLELGMSVGRWGTLGLELAPSYTQPRRVIEESIGYEDGSERMLLANIGLRTEPIENLQPYFLFGGGQGVFTFRYAGAGKEIRPGTFVKEETLKAWLGAAGVGFEGPISHRFYWGLRGRFIYHRWQASTNEGRFLPVDSGNSYVLEGTLAARF